MNRHVHLWFFTGMLITGAAVAAVGMTIAVMTASGSAGSISVVLMAEALVMLAALRRWIVCRRARERQYERVSREMKCRWGQVHGRRGVRTV